jgi:hypothetical protein
MPPVIMKKNQKNSIDGVNLPDSRLVELLDKCEISIKDFLKNKKKDKNNGKESK